MNGFYKFTKNNHMRVLSLKLVICLFALLLLNKSAYALKPDKEYYAIPDTLNLPFEKNTITTQDGVKLKSWTFLPTTEASNKTTLVIAYADAGNMSGYITQAAILSQLGYTILLFDYRGFGASDGFAIDTNMLYYNEFATDLTAAVKFAKAKYSGNKTGIWCFSMGTIITTLSAKESHPDFIIGDSYVTSPAAIKAYYAPKDKQLNLPADAPKYDVALTAIHIPMLIFSGTEDKVTTQASIKKLKATKTNLKIVSYKGGHMHGFYVMSDKSKYMGSGYVEAINKFLDNN